VKKGIQLYSVRDKCTNKASFFQTITNLAQMGYDGVEFFEYYGASANELKSALQSVSMQGFNTHVGFSKWFEDPIAEIKYAAQAGIPNVSLAWIPLEERNVETYRRVHRLLIDASQWCADYGITMCYHNHDFEYETMDGTYLLDMLLQFNPKLSLELDTFWVHYCGLNPIDQMENYANRIKLLHLKDYLHFEKPYVDMGKDLSFCALGTGKMNNDIIIQQAKNMGIEWVVADLDNSPIDSFETARISLAYLKSKV
jgi:sugar phosphate isomerase/epimerase